jgi:ribonuclease J
MEGTHTEAIGERKVTEWGLERQVIGHIRRTKGIALAHFSPMHVDRLVTFIRAAMRTGRIFVADHYTAWVMYLIHGQCNVHDPRKGGTEVKVYYPEAFLKTYKRKNQKCVFEKFLGNRIGMDEILASPERFVMLFRPPMIDQDFNGRLPEGSCCIYSYWAGYLEKPQWKDFEKKVAAAGGRFVQAHTSGHIFAEDTKRFLRDIRPGLVIPIHTFAPEAFHAHGCPVRTLNDGEVFEVA